MAESQLGAITDLLRASPLDMGGDPHTMRIVFDEMIGSHPVPEDVRTITVELGGVSAIAVTAGGGGGAGGGAVLPRAGDASPPPPPAPTATRPAHPPRRSSTTVYTVDYRLAPENPF